eukprot:4754367-Pleurochrysis_carterae.AAC.2
MKTVLKMKAAVEEAARLAAHKKELDKLHKMKPHERALVQATRARQASPSSASRYCPRRRHLLVIVPVAAGAYPFCPSSPLRTSSIVLSAPSPSELMYD